MSARRCLPLLPVLALAACAPDDAVVGDVLQAGPGLSAASCAGAWIELSDVPAPEPLVPEPPETARGLPLSSVTGVAASARGLVVGGVSADPELFWDAWVVPDDGAPRRLAPVGNNLVSVDASGALWTAITDFGPTGRPAYETRLSPTDGSPSFVLSPDLPPGFSAERAVSDGRGGRLLAGSEELDGTPRGAVFAIDAGGHAARIACAPKGDAPLFLDAALAPDALHLVVQHTPEGPATLVRISRP